MTAEELYRQRGGTFQLMGDESGQWQGIANPMLMHQIQQELQAASNPSLLSKLGDIGQSMVPVNYTVGSGGLVNSSGQAVKRVTIPGEFEPGPGDVMIPKTAWLTQQAAQQIGVPWEGESTQYQSGETGLDRFMMSAVPAATMAIMGAGALDMLPGAGAAAGGGASAGGTAGSLMPAAIPESAATLSQWGLVEVAPGVFAAPGAAAAGAAGTAGALMPPAVPASPQQLAQWGLTETAPGVYTNVGNAATFGSSLATPPMGTPPGVEIAGGTGMPPGVSTGAQTLFGQLKDTAKELSPYAPLLGAVGGGLLGATSGTGSAGSITVEDGIPDWLMPYVKPTLDKYSTQVQNYNVDPYGIMPAAAQEFQKTISGQYLDPATNKWLEQYFNLGAERVKGTLSPSFGHMQAFGSHSGYNEALSRGLGDLATGLYGGAYERERDRQNQMIAAAPNFLTQSSTSAFAPYQQYLSSVSNLGKKRDQPYFEPSAFQNILGGAMAGYGLGGIFKT